MASVEPQNREPTYVNEAFWAAVLLVLPTILRFVGCFVSRGLEIRLRRWLTRLGLLATLPPGRIVAVRAAGEPPTPEDKQWAKKLADLKLNGLAGIRGSAEKWSASIAALTGVFGIVGLIEGRKTISELDRSWEIVVGCLAAAALLLALRGILLAALAAQGSPSTIEATAAKLRRFYENEAFEAADLLRYSRVLVVVAVLFAGAAVGVTWFGPEHAAAPQKKLVVTDGGYLCGTLQLDGANAIVGSARVPLSRVRSIVSVPDCPAG